MDIKIRRANLSDNTNLYFSLVKWFDELSEDLKFYPGVTGYTGIWIADLVANHIVFVAEVCGEIVGSVGLRLTNFPWNKDAPLFVNDFFMTDRQYRSYGIAKMLLNEAKRISDNLDIPVLFGIMTGTDPELKDRFFKMCGFKYTGGNFIYGGK